MGKQLVFQKPCNGPQLLEALLAGVPSLRPVADPAGALGPDGQPARVAVFQLSTDAAAGVVTLDVPDGADEAAINRVVEAHVPAEPEPPEPPLTAQLAAALAALRDKATISGADLVQVIALLQASGRGA